MNILFTILITAGIILICFILKKLKFTQAILSACSGIAALFCCDFLMSMTGYLSMPINPYTLSISAAGGIPGVILLVLLDMLR